MTNQTALRVFQFPVLRGGLWRQARKEAQQFVGRFVSKGVRRRSIGGGPANTVFQIGRGHFG